MKSQTVINLIKVTEQKVLRIALENNYVEWKQIPK